MKTSELTGEALDNAVAIALGWEQRLCGAIPVWHKKGVEDSYRGRVSHWKPSVNWEQGGPIIERERIVVQHMGFASRKDWQASNDRFLESAFDGKTYLIAAMRCFVASKFGEEVEDDK